MRCQGRSLQVIKTFWRHGLWRSSFDHRRVFLFESLHKSLQAVDGALESSLVEAEPVDAQRNKPIYNATKPGKHSEERALPPSVVRPVCRTPG